MGMIGIGRSMLRSSLISKGIRVGKDKSVGMRYTLLKEAINSGKNSASIGGESRACCLGFNSTMPIKDLREDA